MPQPREPRRRDATDDWLLVGGSVNAPVEEQHSGDSPEIDTNDMTGLLASMKLQCGELAEAQQILEQSLENQAHEIETQKQQLSSIQDELHRSLEEHTLDMRQRLTEEIIADCEALRKELRQDLATDVGKLQSEMERIMQLLHEETEQRRREIQALEESMEQSRNTQQETLGAVDERMQRLEERIAALETSKDHSRPSRRGARDSPAGASAHARECRDGASASQQDHETHLATGKRSVFCEDCHKELTAQMSGLSISPRKQSGSGVVFHRQ
ncbi:hypothetical protein PRZ48_010540 [Zasmidium cellare]|uniref:Uncharacterized protein n=1 Tax=Zasmidium cellare TaxID=395010 RepID=A0ABR0E8X8_ZASCE|nr:hypothetical protein PRZ48_010540 [Zasmidium cellare]